MTQVIRHQKALGDWESKSNNTVYQDVTDGDVCAYHAGAVACLGLTDGANPPTTARQKNGDDVAATTEACINFPVKKGDYWKVTGAGGGSDYIYWIPES